MKKQPPAHNTPKLRDVLLGTGAALGIVALAATQILPRQEASRVEMNPVSDKQVVFTAKSIAQLGVASVKEPDGRYALQINKTLSNPDKPAETISFNIRLTSTDPIDGADSVSLKSLTGISCNINEPDQPSESGTESFGRDIKSGDWKRYSESIAVEDDQFCFAVINQVASS